MYYEDTDAGGVVFHANYLKFFERARTEMLRSMRFEQDILREEHGVLFAVRSANVEYLSPARFNEMLDVTAKIANRKKATLVFEQAIVRGQDLLCTASVRIACLDSNSLKPKPIPNVLLQQLI